MPIERKSFTRTEIRAGIFVFVSGVVFLAFMAAILKWRPVTGDKTFFIAMTDIGGLDRSADVRFGGMVVGRVTHIGPHSKNRSQMLITAKVNTTTPVNAASRAYIGQVSLTTEKHLEITTGAADAPLLKSGDSIEPSPPVGMFGDISGLTTNVQGLITDVQVLLGVSDGKGNRILAAKNTRTVAEIFQSLDEVMTDLRGTLGAVDANGQPIPADQRRTLNDLMGKLDGAMEDGRKLIGDVRDVLAENRQQIKDLLASAKDLSATANHAVGNIDDLITDNREHIDSLITNTSDTVKKLNDMMTNIKSLVATLQSTLDRNAPALDETMKLLDNTLRNLEDLTRTLADEPQSIIRGREPVGRK